MSSAPLGGAANAPGSPQKETGKQRSARIPLDYYKQRTPLERWKLGLSLLALVAAVGYWGWGFAQGSKGDQRYSRGPVCSVHSAWEVRCDACHDSFAGLNPGGFKKVSDVKCQACHFGPQHMPNEKVESVPSCGGCHRDHRGREASLVRLPDSDCTSCHRDLGAHSTGHAFPGIAFTPAITSFATDHPEFLRSKTDPGRVKFNHKQHLTPGQVHSAGAGGGWTLGKILANTDKATYERYKNAPWQEKKGDDDFVQLDCASCHRLDAGDLVPGERVAGLPEGLLQPRAPGAYMQPITFEIQCKACHPLNFDANVKGADDRPLWAPHRVQPPELRHFLEGVYASRALGEKSSDVLFGKLISPRTPLPGKAGSPEEKASEVIRGKANGSLQFLLANCSKCHYEGDGRQDTPLAEKSLIPPADIPMVWQQYAKFSHVAHRAMNCKDCHAAAYDSVTHKDVLLPAIDNCRQCHAPQKSEGDKLIGGVRHGCTDCHNYHHGVAPLQGLGAVARDPKSLLDVQQFLRGAAPK
jgi:hypothetical protein